VAVGDVAPCLYLDPEGLRLRGDEVPPQEAAQHDRRVDLLELVDGVVLDVVALGDELGHRPEPQVRVCHQVARELGGEEVDVGRGAIEIARPQVPERHRLIVRRALVVRRVAGAKADRPVDRVRRRRREQGCQRHHARASVIMHVRTRAMSVSDPERACGVADHALPACSSAGTTGKDGTYCSLHATRGRRQARSRRVGRLGGRRSRLGHRQAGLAQALDQARARAPRTPGWRRCGQAARATPWPRAAVSSVGSYPPAAVPPRARSGLPSC
jgi:hypothetical protein